jgi:hypothetical protein
VSMPFTAPVAVPSTSEAASHAMHQSALDVLSSEQYAAIVDHVTAHVTGQFEDKLTAKSQQVAELERQLGVVRNAMRTSDDHEGDDGARNKIENELTAYDWEVEEYEVRDVELA